MAQWGPVVLQQQMKGKYYQSYLRICVVAAVLSKCQIWWSKDQLTSPSHRSPEALQMSAQELLLTVKWLDTHSAVQCLWACVHVCMCVRKRHSDREIKGWGIVVAVAQRIMRHKRCDHSSEPNTLNFKVESFSFLIQNELKQK